MNAYDAKLLADKVVINCPESQLEDIMTLIEKAANSGHYQLVYYGALKEAVVFELKQKGYIVCQGSVYKNEALTPIKW